MYFGLWTFPPDKDGPAIPRPAPIGRMDDEFHLREVPAGPTQITPRQFFFRPVDEDADDLARCNLAAHFTIDPPNRVKLARPIGGVPPPAHPAHSLPFPFRRPGT